MSGTDKPKRLSPNTPEYDLVYTHLERVLEQPVGAAKGNHAALMMVLSQLGYGSLGKSRRLTSPSIWWIFPRMRRIRANQILKDLNCEKVQRMAQKIDTLEMTRRIREKNSEQLQGFSRAKRLEFYRSRAKRMNARAEKLRKQTSVKAATIR